MFVRHVSLLRNLGEGGKLRLAADMAQVRRFFYFKKRRRQCRMWGWGMETKGKGNKKIKECRKEGASEEEGQ